MDLISVIVPVYNVQQYLPRCLDSIINQSYKRLEIILIDDGSTDESGNICDDYSRKDNRIIVIHKENGGVSSARNIGLDKASGEYIGFIDSDDIIEYNMYEILYNNIVASHCEISVCQMDTINVDGSKGIIHNESSNLFENKFIINEFFLNDFIKDIMYSQCNKLFKSSILKDIRYKKFKYAEDILFIFESVCNCTKIYYDNRVCYHYEHREKSAMTSNFGIDRLDYLNAIKIIGNMCDCKYVYASKNANIWIYQHRLNTLRQIYCSANNNEFEEFIVEDRKYLKQNKKKYLKYLSKKRVIDYYCIIYLPFAVKPLNKLLKR